VSDSLQYYAAARCYKIYLINTKGREVKSMVPFALQNYQNPEEW